MESRIALYTSTTCPNCKSIKEHFENAGLVEDKDFTIRNINEETRHRKFLISKAIFTVPVVVFDETNIITGYNREEIDAIIAQL